MQDNYEEEFQMTQQFNLIPQMKIMTHVFNLLKIEWHGH